MKKRLAALSLILALALFCTGALADVLTLPAELQSIEAGAFSGNTSLDRVVMPDNLERIESRAFAGSSVKAVDFTASITQIADDAFDGVERMDVTAPEGSYAYNWAVRNGYIFSGAYPESKHPYANDCDEQWIYRAPQDCAWLLLTFDRQSELEESCDYLRVTTNGDYDQSFTGTDLVGKRLLVPGDVVTLRLTSDGSVTEWGFKILDIEPMSQADYEEYRRTHVYDYLFEEDKDDEIVISRYLGSEAELTVPETIDGYRVVRIGSNAFSDNGTLTKVSLPDSVRTLDYGAFSNCEKLANVALPQKLESIEYRCFGSCPLLAAIDLPDALTYIDDSAFDDPETLTTVTAQKGTYAYLWAVRNGYISDDGFLVAINETNGQVALGDDGVTTVAHISGNMESVSFNVQAPNTWSVAFADTWVYNEVYETQNLDVDTTSYTIDVAENGTNAARQTTVTFTCGDETVAFVLQQEPYLMVNMLAPAGLGREQPYAVYDVNDGDITLEWEKDDRAAGYKVYFNTSSYREFYPEVVDAGNGRMKAVIPAARLEPSGSEHHVRISAIDQYGHYYDYSEKSAGNYFYFLVQDSANPDWGYRLLMDDDENVTGVALTKRFAEVGETLEIPATFVGYPVTELGSNLLKDCVQLRKVTIPATVTEIYRSAFEGCTALDDVTLPEGLTYMGDYTFCGCASLTAISVPGSVKSLSDHLFQDCVALERVELGEGIQDIYSEAFSGCVKLTELHIPASVDNIADTAFSGCDNIQFQGVEEGTYIAEWLDNHGYNDPPTVEGLESPHPYESDMTREDWTWTYAHPDTAQNLKVTFSKATATEDDYDYIYITDADGERQFTGDELSGVTLELKGNTFTIQMETDSSIEMFGFRVLAIEAVNE